jgi:hypothetical protein
MANILTKAATATYTEAAHLISGDDAAYVQRKIDALGSGGGTVVLPNEDLDITRPVIIRGERVILQGAGATRLRVRDTTEAGLILHNATSPSVRDLTLVADGRLFELVSIRRVEWGPGVPVPTNPGFSNVVLDGGSRNAWNLIGFSDLSGTNQNNEHGRFVNVRGMNFEHAFVRIGHNQSKEHVFEHCNVTGGQYGVVAHGSFRWRDGAMSGLDEAFMLSSPSDNVIIQGVGVEATRRLLTTAGPTSAAWPITLQGVRYAADAMADDDNFIVMQTPGPLSILGCDIGGGNVRIPHVLTYTPNQVIGAVVEGNSFTAFGAVPEGFFRDPSGAPPKNGVIRWGPNAWATGLADPNCVIR